MSLRAHAFAALRAALLSGDEDAVARAEDEVRIAILSTATADLHDDLHDVLEHGDPLTVAWMRRELARWEDSWGG